MKMSFVPLGGTQRRTIGVKVTTAHSASSYGQPVLVDASGELLDANALVLCDYRIESVSAQELELLRRSPLAVPEWSPWAQQIANAKPRRGRPLTGEPRQRIYLTLPLGEIEELRELGNGSASAGVSRLLRERTE